MSDSEDSEETSIRIKFDTTTINFVGKFVQSAGASSELVNKPSFKKFLRHLNPLVSIPTVLDIEQKDGNRVRSVPEPCIVCSNGDPMDSITLSVDHAAIILIGTLIESSNPNFEVARRLQSTSLRMCYYHIPEVFRKMYKSLNIEKTKKLKYAKMAVLDEWRIQFLDIKKFQSGEKEKNFDIIKFYTTLQNFIDHFYPKKENATTSKNSATKRKIRVKHDEEDDEDEEESSGGSEKQNDSDGIDDGSESPPRKRRAVERPMTPDRESTVDLQYESEETPNSTTLIEPKVEVEENGMTTSSPIDDESWPTASSYLSSEGYKNVIRDVATTGTRHRERRRRYSPS